MAQIGEKIYDVGSQQFQQLNEQINDANNGIAGRVNQLEASADVSNVNPYDPDRAYQAGNMAIVGGRLKRANKATTGVLVEADWEDPSPTATVTANRAVVSDSTGKLAPSAVTDVELAQIRGGSAIQDDDIIDDGAFLHNAAGTMKQTGFPALWRWIVNKVTGSASTALTDNLTASRVAVINSQGKFAASDVTSGELTALDGTNTPITVTLEDTDGAVINDGGTTRQVRLSSVFSYISNKLNGAISSVLTSNLTTSRALISDSNGKIAVSSTTANELAIIRGGATVESFTLQDADGFVVNDGGSMKQARIDNIYSYMTTKYGIFNESSTVTSSNRNFVPSSNEAINIGESGRRVKNGYFSTVWASTFSVYGSNILFNNTNGNVAYFSGGGSLRHPGNFAPDIGDSTDRYRNIYLSNSPNVSSDEDLKEEIKEIPEVLLDVWFDYVQPVQYLYKDRNKEHEANQIKVGYIAQDIIAAFEAAGIDWHLWDVVSENADFDEEDDVDKSGNDYYSVNYTAAQLIEQTAIRNKLGIKKSKRF
ncbi:TPA: tail fiber domain-containing protein, partial [Vibrio cholerae]|nr:tail fiber domain-containing protein [Vibrio cholerae]